MPRDGAYLGLAPCAANDRESAVLDRTSAIPRVPPQQGHNVSRRPIRCASNRTIDRRGVLRRRGEQPVGGRAADPGDGPAEAPARGRASDLVSRGHRRPMLRQHHRRGGDRGRCRRSRRVHTRRCACHVEPSRHARRARHAERDRLRDFRGRAVLPQCRQRRAGLGQTRLRLPRLRLASVQSAARSPAAGHQDRQSARRRCQLARPVHSPGADRIGGEAGRRRKRSRQAERADVHRGGSPVPGNPAAGAGGLAGGAARPVRRQGPVADARQAGAGLDD